MVYLHLPISLADISTMGLAAVARLPLSRQSICSCSRLAVRTQRHPAQLPRLQIPARLSPTFTRQASTAAALEIAPQTAPLETSSTIQSIHQHISLIEDDIGGDQYWADRLREAALDLEPRNTRVSIYGDSMASPEDVVSAILQTPFSDEAEISSFISDRKVSESPEILKFEYVSMSESADCRFQSTIKRDTNRLGLPSGWLQQSGADLYEITGTHPTRHLLRSDVKVVVVDPIRLLDTESIRSLPPPLLAQSTVIVNGHLPSGQTTESVAARLRQTLPPTSSGHVLFSNAQLAIEAYTILRSGGRSPPPDVVTAFQTLFLASGVGQVQRQLAEAVQTSRRRPSDLVLDLAGHYARSRVEADTTKAQQMLRVVKDLRTTAASAARRAHNLSVANREIDGGAIQGSVQSSRTEAARRIESVFQDRLSWLSLLFRLRVDDVAAELDREVARSFVDVEQQLVYESGQLFQLQHHLSGKADKIIRAAEAPFHSAVLTNRLSTLSLSIPPVEPTTLIEPIHRRRLQIATEIIPLVQHKARWISYQTYLGAAGGVAASWAAYVPPLELVSASTGAGLAILSVLASIWSGQTRWGKTQKAFWRSWNRVNDMMGSDIKVAFSSAVDSFVVAKPNAAAEGLEQLVQKRLAVLSKLEERIDSISPRKP